MKRSVIAFILLFPIAIYTFSEDRFTANDCGNCHQPVIAKALASRYRHSVVVERCPLCHINQGNPPEATITMHGNGFLPPRKVRIDVCVTVRCHPQGVSHPVGGRVKEPKFKQPKNLPLIEGDVMTCATCHEPHGGNLKYMLRKDFMMDVCIECHRNND